VTYFLGLLAGLAVGLASRRRWSHPSWTRALNVLLSATLVAVLGAMAARLGADPAVTRHGPSLILQSAALAAAASAGSVALIALCRRWLP